MLRTNGGIVEIINKYPFVVSRELVEWSNHVNYFFSNLFC